MKVELKKRTEESGNIWYGVWINESCEATFPTVEEAKEYYDSVKREKKTETIMAKDI